MKPELSEKLYQCESHHWWWRARWRIISRIIGTIPAPAGGFNILDAGCSTGALWRWIPGPKKILGFDMDMAALKRASHGNGNLFAAADLTHLPVKSGYADLVLALDVIEHLPDPKDVLAEMKRVLRPGGALIITVPAFQWLWSEWDEYNDHFRRYSRTQLLRELEAAGFRLRFASYFNSFLFLPFLAAHLARKYLGVWKDPLEQAQIPKTNVFLECIFAAERHWLAKRIPLPVGSSLIAIVERA